MKAYVAAPFEERLLAMEILQVLEYANIDVVSSWLYVDADTRPIGLMAPHEQSKAALRDLEEIQAADIVVVLGSRDYAHAGTGGRHVELGFALGIGKPVFLLGDRTNIFHHLPAVRRILPSESLIEVIRAET